VVITGDPGSGPALSHARVRPQIPGSAPPSGKPPALAAPPPARPASPTSNATASSDWQMQVIMNRAPW